MKISVPPFFAALALPVAALAPPTDLIYGHYELHVDYSVTPGDPDAGWRFSVSYDEDGDFSSANGVVRLDPETTRIVTSPRTETAVPSPAGVFGRFGPSGTPIRVLPQNNLLGAPYLGVRTTMATGIFQARVGNNYSPSTQGSVSLRLVSLTGTGPDVGGEFAAWKTESFGSTVFAFDSTDGITGADEIPTIPVSFHTHYNWGFTQPGVYYVTLEAKGKLMPVHGSAITTAQTTFTFVVPFSSRVGDAGQLRIVAGESGAPSLLAADPAGGVAYVADRAMLEAGRAATAASDALPGAVWEMSGELSSAAASLPNGVGVAPDLASGGLDPAEWADLAWSISEVRGPGNFALIGDGVVLAGGAGDSIPLAAGTTRDIVAAFSATGIYRVTGTLHGLREGAPVASPPVTLVFGAGITAGHDYAAWAASFEQTAGLPAGTLADPEADHDGDGLANGVEFAFFWQGLDPTRPDADRMPHAFLTAEGFGAIDFLRDTYKDPLDESKWEIRPQASEELIAWRLRSSRVPGRPLGLFETGAGEGNALGRIGLRRLRFADGSGERAFFRFQVDAP